MIEGCPVPLLIKTARQFVEYNEAEWRGYDARN